MQTARLGIIGGTGLYSVEGMSNIQTLDLTTPFGKPSDAITTGELGETKIAFLPRHGKGHHIAPGEIPSLANICALKMIGVEQILAFNAVGSLREEICPGDIVIPDQFIDKTTRRRSSFFGDGLVAHISFADPVCKSLAQAVFDAAIKTGANAHFGGTYIVMEGPAFSTRAESILHRSWGAHVIGMTALPEAKLAREAGICYATVACVTDYDAWHESEEPVSVDMILRTLHSNTEASKQIIRQVVTKLPSRNRCSCASALSNAIVTDPEVANSKRIEELKLITSKYLEI
ncbi:MAG: S-methyl-5'-thioadenosine phosphorylase [Dehalococcoidales bacterium]|nr:S-methyl-5'-thioadenosine phosphorylase [Dehalococcoidales bacterium]MDD4322034.1 S-methyl-5'-thioadenosine phosphorylase [Dehalococcoidales bacterium]MDD4794411.1 S-methyl-5'-thioadenosine phosphorylase [Dehalococcoidales bacterium]MDD5498005.1 S-methyl-5'-thioadenosine phosphorylase [Dehalococcoidales bacterium]